MSLWLLSSASHIQYSLFDVCYRQVISVNTEGTVKVEKLTYVGCANSQEILLRMCSTEKKHIGRSTFSYIILLHTHFSFTYKEIIKDIFAWLVTKMKPFHVIKT